MQKERIYFVFSFFTQQLVLSRGSQMQYYHPYKIANTRCHYSQLKKKKKQFWSSVHPSTSLRIVNLKTKAEIWNSNKKKKKRRIVLLSIYCYTFLQVCGCKKPQNQVDWFYSKSFCHNDENTYFWASQKRQQ